MKSKKLMQRVLSFCLAFIILCFSITPARAGIFGKSDKEKQKDADISFYKIASAASTYYEELHNEKSDKYDDGKGMDKIKTVKMGNAASLMGFKDEDYDSWVIGATISKLSSSAQGRGYTAPEKGVMAYLLYGNALNQLGLDKTDNANFNAISSILRKISGFFFFGAFYIATVADFAMQGTADILIKLNPFTLFTEAGGIPDNMKDKNVGETALGLKGLAKVLSRFYKDCQDFAWIIIPVMFGILVWFLLMKPKDTGNRSRIRKYITRVFFIVLGVPLCASVLVFSLLLFKDMKSSMAYSANGIVAMTFMDFETWSRYSRLALPKGHTITVDTTLTNGGTISGDTANPQLIAFAMNSHITGNAAPSSILSDSLNPNGSDDFIGSGRIAESHKERVKNAADVISRFMSGAFYESAAFESDVRKDLTSEQIDIDNLGDKGKWHDSDPSFVMEDDGGTIVNDADKKSLEFSHPNDFQWIFSGWGDGFASKTRDEDGNIVSEKEGGGVIDNRKAGVKMKGGLSTLGMYNYLNTTFTPATVTVYSNNKASSKVIRDAHRSVSLVGQGLMAPMNYLTGLILFSLIGTIGIGYGIGMLIGNLKRTIRLIVAVPFAVTGSLKMAARLVTIVGMMVVEIMGTIIMYFVVMQMIYGVNKVVTLTFSNLIKGLDYVGAIGLPVVNGFVFELFLVSVFTIIINIWFLIMALRLRKSVLKALNEWMASVVDRIFMTGGPQGGGIAQSVNNDNRSSQKGAGPVAAGAAGVAGGAALGASMSAKSKGGENGVKGEKGATVAGTEEGGAQNASGEQTDIEEEGTGIEGSERQETGSEGADGADGEAKSIESADANQRGEAMLNSGATSLKELSEKAREKEKAKQAEMDSFVQGISGKTGALEEEKDKEAIKEAKKEAKAEKKAAAGKAAVGAVETVAGVKTKNPEAVKDGAKRTAEGVKGVKAADKKAKNAKSDVAKERLAKNEAKKTVKGQKAAQAEKAQNMSVANNMKNEKAKAQRDADRKKAVTKSVVGETKSAVKTTAKGAAGGKAGGATKGVQGMKAGTQGAKAVQGAKTATQGAKTVQGAKTAQSAKTATQGAKTVQGAKVSQSSKTVQAGTNKTVQGKNVSNTTKAQGKNVSTSKTVQGAKGNTVNNTKSMGTNNTKVTANSKNVNASKNASRNVNASKSASSNVNASKSVNNKANTNKNIDAANRTARNINASKNNASSMNRNINAANTVNRSMSQNASSNKNVSNASSRNVNNMSDNSRRNLNSSYNDNSSNRSALNNVNDTRVNTNANVVRNDNRQARVNNQRTLSNNNAARSNRTFIDNRPTKQSAGHVQNINRPITKEEFNRPIPQNPKPFVDFIPTGRSRREVLKDTNNMSFFSDNPREMSRIRQNQIELQYFKNEAKNINAPKQNIKQPKQNLSQKIDRTVNNIDKGINNFEKKYDVKLEDAIDNPMSLLSSLFRNNSENK